MQAAWRNFEDWSTSRSFEAFAAYGAGWNQSVIGPEGAAASTTRRVASLVSSVAVIAASLVWVPAALTWHRHR